MQCILLLSRKAAGRAWGGGLDIHEQARQSLLAVKAHILGQPIPQAGAVQLKADGSRVSQGDLFYDALIARSLQASLPHCRIVSEESVNQEAFPSLGWAALIDPLDGTENFTDGRPEWGISIWLAFQGREAGAALILPSIRAGLVSGDCLDAPFRSEVLAVSAADVGAPAPPGFRGYRANGSAVWNIYHVLRGGFAGFRSGPVLSAWDIQAGLSLSCEAGCEARVNGLAYDHRPLDLQQRHRIELTAVHALVKPGRHDQE